MLTISPSTAFLLYLGFTLFALTVLATNRYLKTKNQKNAQHQRRVLQCEYCASSYLVSPFTHLHRCPQCRSINEEKRYKSISRKK